MSKEMRKYIDNFRNFEKSKLNEGFFDDIVSGAKSSWKRNVTGTYKEPVWIWIKYYKNKDYQHCFIENKGLDGEVNIKLMDILNNKFNLNLSKSGKYYVGSTFEFDYSKLEEVSEYLINLGLERKEFERKGAKDICFNGKLSMRDLK
jgi:hypothetical protein